MLTGLLLSTIFYLKNELSFGQKSSLLEKKSFPERENVRLHSFA